MQGFIKLHRIFREWEWYTEPNMVLFMVHCLLRANHKESEWKGIKIMAGQFVSGRKILSAETGLSEQQVRTCIKKLVKTGELSTNIATMNNTVFTLNSWKKYQLQERPTNGITKDQPDTNQTPTTNKNEKNVKNEKNSRKVGYVADNPPSKKEVEDYCLDKGFVFDGLELYDFYTVADWVDKKGNKIKNWKQKAIHVWFKPEHQLVNNNNSSTGENYDENNYK